MGWSRRVANAASAALLGAAAVAYAPRVLAVDLIIGGMAEVCSRAAKAGMFDPPSIEACSTAILSEGLWNRGLAGTYVNRGTMYIARGAYELALSDMDEAIRIEPTMGEAYVNRGGALIGLRRYREAVDEIDKGIALNPDEPEKAYGNRALAKWSLDDLKGAYLDFVKAGELKPDWEWPKQQLAHFTLAPSK